MSEDAFRWFIHGLALGFLLALTACMLGAVIIANYLRRKQGDAVSEQQGRVLDKTENGQQQEPEPSRDVPSRRALIGYGDAILQLDLDVYYHDLNGLPDTRRIRVARRVVNAIRAWEDVSALTSGAASPGADQ